MISLVWNKKKNKLHWSGNIYAYMEAYGVSMESESKSNFLQWRPYIQVLKEFTELVQNFKIYKFQDT